MADRDTLIDTPATRATRASVRETAESPRQNATSARQNATSARETAADRRRRRDRFLRALNEAREVRDRVRPRGARAARMRQAIRMRAFRW